VVKVSSAEREQLDSIARSRSLPHSLVRLISRGAGMERSGIPGYSYAPGKTFSDPRLACGAHRR
jgi:hypothetical protein